MNETQPVQLANMDWPWKDEDPVIGVILISDQQLLTIANEPDRPVEKLYPHATEAISLREHCRRGAEQGATTMRIAYDYFFGGSERSLYPDTPEFQDALKKVGDVAKAYGLDLEPSILSPLELGVGYKQKTGEAGRWLHYREGLRDPRSGQYSVQLWRQTRWTNNKGPMPVTLLGARAFAFREEPIPGTPFFAVDPAAMVELAPPEIETATGPDTDVRELEGGAADPRAMFQSVRVRVHGNGGPQGYDRVLVVLMYETVEMDYFSADAAAFLDDLVEQYHRRGVSLAGVYADEMHIQQDWSYHAHMDAGQFTVRYVSPGFERAFAEQFGEQYADFARYMIYFTSHQHDFLPTHEPKLPSQHVFGPSREAIYRTMLFRRNYYDFLEQHVVKLMVDAREKLEVLYGRAMDAHYHATWAESPTCDAWAPGGVFESWSPEEHRRRYEYTPDFVWSNTVHQAAAACANYFAWNDFLTGGNNDTAEGGYADRDYYARALACSLAALNRRPLASAGMWGMPAAVRERMQAVSAVFGAGGHPIFRAVADYAPRQIEALFLYPQDLVAVDEQFGSWMTLYGYANYITADKLVEMGHAGDDGLLHVKDEAYRVLCILYEPFPSAELLGLIKAFVDGGGTVIWSSAPPMLERRGAKVSSWFTEVFGVELETPADPLGLAYPARTVAFNGALAAVAPMAVLSDFVVDRVFPVQRSDEGVETVATMRTGGAAEPHIVGARKTNDNGGQAIYLGFRPRDDQAASVGVESRAWFEILRAVGAYPGVDPSDDGDNPTVLSRSTPYLATRFPNGALGVAPHYRHHQEAWPGGFFRDEALDAQIMQQTPPPNDAIDLLDWRVAGQVITFRGRRAVLWRLVDGRLLAFAGACCSGIRIGAKSWSWSRQPVDIAWHPLHPEQAIERYRPLFRVWVAQATQVRVPLALDESSGLEAWVGASLPGFEVRRWGVRGRVGYGERRLPFSIDAGDLILNLDEQSAGHWIYLVERR